MAEGINSSASFGQSKNDSEELPIIVAQRFLNIFRQLHIFSDERRESFNKMLLELPPEVKNIFQSLPGGTPLQEYLEDLEQKSKGLEPLAHNHKKGSSNILQDALSEAQISANSGGEGIINSDNFARILASSLAQSNAEIIRELQNSRPATVPSGGTGGENTNISFDGPMKLIADESFTNIISQALAEAMENSERKRLEDNKIITRSFMELQENLTKLIEQNNQIKFISSGDNPGEAVAALQMKGIVDDLVKAQSAFLKETTKSQKEELSSIIATAIKESQKVSTQALIDSFKKINEDKGPAPITYAATSPKGQPSMESVEQALKAQGKEFSSIISMALKESQKNSAQTIIETLETLKKDTGLTQGTQNNLKVEEIMRMQANLFRDIARAQNQEFSALISSALRESQRQSTQAIIAALSQLQTTAVQPTVITVPAAAVPVQSVTDPTIVPSSPADHPAPVQPQAPAVVPEDDNVETAFETDEENQKKKKKKKKKKNRDPETSPAAENNQQEKTIPAPAAEKAPSVPSQNAVKQEPSAEPAPAEVKPEPVSSPATAVKPEPAKPENVSQPEIAPQPAVEKAKPQISETLLKLMTASSAFSPASEIKDNDLNDDWGWGFGDTPQQPDISANNFSDYTMQTENVAAASQTADNDGEWTWSDDNTGSADGEGEDWEWEYEEVPADAVAEGEEGEDWEWEYEEVPADAAAEGEEGEDWEWEYEEVTDEEDFAAEPELTPAPVAATVETTETPAEFIEKSEIVLDEMPQFVLLGLEDEKFRDPYIENNDIIG